MKTLRQRLNEFAEEVIKYDPSFKDPAVGTAIKMHEDILDEVAEKLSAFIECKYGNVLSQSELNTMGYVIDHLKLIHSELKEKQP